MLLTIVSKKDSGISCKWNNSADTNSAGKNKANTTDIILIYLAKVALYEEL